MDRRSFLRMLPLAPVAGVSAVATSVVYAPVYNVVQGADPQAIADLQRVLAEERASLHSFVVRTVRDAQARRRL